MDSQREKVGLEIDYLDGISINVHLFTSCLWSFSHPTLYAEKQVKKKSSGVH